MATSSASDVQQAEFRLYAYVCSVTCVKRSGDPPPTANFAQVYLKRPPDCRYAVVGKWNYSTGADRFYVFDLFAVKKNNDDGQLLTPMPRLRHDDLDAAIMATVLLYNSKEKR